MGGTVHVGLPDDAVPIGVDHWVTFVRYTADQEPDAPAPAGIVEWHYRADRPGEQVLCAGAVMWWRPEAERGQENKPVWDLVSLDPLDLNPSVHCNPAKPAGEEDPARRGCGMHGYIHGGVWTDA